MAHTLFKKRVLLSGTFWRGTLVVIVAATLATVFAYAWTGPGQAPPGGDPAPPGSTPTGQVAFFNLASCPSGWTELTAARGRYIVGLPLSGTLAPAPGTACTEGIDCRGAGLSNLEDRATGQHNHPITDPGHNHSSTVSVYLDPDAGIRVGASSNPGDSIGPVTTTTKATGITINNAGTVAGTNAPYIQLLACQKS